MVGLLLVLFPFMCVVCACVGNDVGGFALVACVLLWLLMLLVLLLLLWWWMSLM